TAGASPACGKVWTRPRWLGRGRPVGRCRRRRRSARRDTSSRTRCKERPMLELPTGTVTFLFTDLEGSTARWEQQPEAMRHALARHDACLRDAIERHGGHVFKTVGDAFHAAFASAPEAVAAALDAQRCLLAEDWAPLETLRVRMALHTGAAELRD